MFIELQVFYSSLSSNIAGSERRDDLALLSSLSVAVHEHPWIGGDMTTSA
jgi:hypothetical protein